jgi:hypothetical protein
MEKNQTKSVFVHYDIPVNETVQFSCCKSDNTALAKKVLFRIDSKEEAKSYYFFFVLNRNNRTLTFSLREIKSDEYEVRKSELISLRPAKNIYKWLDEEKNVMTVEDFKSGFFRRTMPALDCQFITENPVRKLCENVLSCAELKKQISENLDKQEKHEYAKKCGALSQKYGISFVNVMRIGTNVNELKQFKQAYDKVLFEAPSWSIQKKRAVHNGMFRGDGRNVLQQTLDELKIPYFNADVNCMDFSELKDILEKALRDYVEESVKIAAQNCSEMEYEERQKLYDATFTASRSKKKEILDKLGVDVEAINVNTYPLARVKRILATSLGFDAEE